jgi:general secretion pathway protein K
MNRRGFALLAVLWLVTTLSLLAATGLVAARHGLKASGNRVTLTRAAWAREACVEIMLARGFTTARDGKVTVTRTGGRMDLGRETWCELQVEDPSAALNLNLAPEGALKALLANDSLADALLDWRDKDDVARPAGAEADWYRRHRRLLPRNGPLVSLQELDLVRGFESLDSSRLATLLTVWGRGQINLNRASAAVLRAALGIPHELVQLIRERNLRGRPVENLDNLIGLAPASQRAMLAARYQELIQAVSFAPSELVVIATAGVGASPLRSTITLTVVPLSGRVAVIRRQVE